MHFAIDSQKQNFAVTGRKLNGDPLYESKTKN